MTGDRSLRIRLVFAVGVLVVLSLAGLLAIEKEAEKQEARVAALDLGGRQRVLLERAARLAGRLGETGDAATANRLREELGSVARELDRGRAALAAPGTGARFEDELPDGLGRILHEPPADLDRRLREFIAAAGTFAAGEGVAGDADRERARGLVASAESSGLPATLDEAVRILEDEAGNRALSRVQWIVAGAFLLVVIGVAGLVVLPAARELELENRRLRQAERRFRDLVESSPDGIVLGSPDGTVVLANPQAERLFGYGPGALAGKPVDGLVPAPLRARHRERSREYFARPELRPMGSGLQLLGLRADGSTFPVEISLSPLETEDGVMVVAAIRDVTEQRAAAERLRQLNETLEQRVSERTELAENRARELARSNDELQHFALVASHDLREPLRKVESFGERLAESSFGQLGAQGRDYLERMRRAVARMQALIDGLLAYSRVGSAPFTMVPVDLGGILDAVLADLDDLVARSGARISVGPLPAIRGEPALLRELFQNVISNACKFRRPDVEPEVSVRQEPEAGEPGRVRIVVEDNGIGFDNEYRERIFQIFQRLHGRSEFDGTGIGLAVCRRIVQRHGGTIEASGRPGEGATVTITFPRLDVAVPEIAADRSGAVDRAPPARA